MNKIDQRIEDNPIVSGEALEQDSLLQNARSNFVRKVYSILTMQMMVTTAFVLLSINSSGFSGFQQGNKWLFWVSLVVSMVSLIVLFCARKAATTFPYNIMLLAVFTLSESYIVSFITTLYSPASVLNAAVATLGASLGLTLFAVKTKSDFSDSYSKCAGFFWSFLMVSMFLVILNVFWGSSGWLNVLIAVLFAGIYSVYLIIDTQLIMGGKRQELSLDNYVLGAAMLYIDIIQLFLNLLRILGDNN